VKKPALAIAAALCRTFEGYLAAPYLCPAGVPTIGYGATYYEDGTRVQLLDPPITKARAEQLLLWHLEKRYLPQVLAACPSLIHETPERLAAIIDFTFNLGAGNLRASTLRKRINAGAWGDVPNQLMRWNKAGGVVLRGLTRRRQAEANLV
jgi:lysozyme